MDGFTLDSRLQSDSTFVLDLPLCQLRLSNDSSYPWLLLIPRCANISEIIELTDEEQQQLWLESQQLCHCLNQCFAPDKLNVAALGNVVPQLHVHHIARYHNDVAWPDPVWGRPGIPYETELLEHRLAQIRQFFNQESEV